MASNIVHITHIDTGGHGYLSVSKKDIVRIGYDHTKITGSSGHTLSRVYLEEDEDGSNFIGYLKANNVPYKIKSGYNLKFKIDHGYKPELFNYVPKAGDWIKVGQTEYQVLHGHGEEGLTGIKVWQKETRRQYKIPHSNPFAYITEFVSTAMDRAKKILNS